VRAIRIFFAHAILFGAGAVSGWYLLLPWLKRDEADWFFGLLLFLIALITSAFAVIIKNLEMHAPKELTVYYRERYEVKLAEAKSWYYSRYFASILISGVSIVITKFSKTPGDIALAFAFGLFGIAVYYSVTAVLAARKISHELRELVRNVEKLHRRNKLLGIGE
jgi:hypothetical protein